MYKERRAWAVPGIPVAIGITVVLVALSLALIWYVINVLTQITDDASALWPVVGFIVLILAVGFVAFLYAGLTPVNPNEARVLVLFGRYADPSRPRVLHGELRAQRSDGRRHRATCVGLRGHRRHL